MIFSKKKGALLSNALLLMGFILLNVIYISKPVFASEFDVNKYNKYVEYEQTQQGFSDSALSSSIKSGVSNVIASVVDIGFDIFSIVFIFGVIGIAAGVTLQNGQWTKWSTGAMYGTFLAIIAIRIAPIIVLTIDQIGITLVINDAIQLFTSVGLYISILMFLIGLFLRSLNKIFDHPKYFRWSRSLLFGSLIIVTLSFVSPIIIMNL